MTKNRICGIGKRLEIILVNEKGKRKRKKEWMALGQKMQQMG